GVMSVGALHDDVNTIDCKCCGGLLALLESSNWSKSMVVLSNHTGFSANQDAPDPWTGPYAEASVPQVDVPLSKRDTSISDASRPPLVSSLTTASALPSGDHAGVR